MTLYSEKIRHVAGELDIGLTCYIHKETKETKSIPDIDTWDDDLSLWQEAIQDIESNRADYIKIKKMSSHSNQRDEEKWVERFLSNMTDL